MQYKFLLNSDRAWPLASHSRCTDFDFHMKSQLSHEIMTNKNDGKMNAHGHFKTRSAPPEFQSSTLKGPGPGWGPYGPTWADFVKNH